MSRPTRGTVATLSLNGGSTSPFLVPVTVPAGDGRGLLIRVQFRRSGSEEITAMSRDGQSIAGGQIVIFPTGGTFNGTGWATRFYYLNNANAGTADLSVTLSANRNCRITVIPYTGLDIAGTPWGTPVRESDLSTAFAGVTEDMELVAMVGAYRGAAGAGTFTPTGTGQTELDDAPINDQYAASSYQHEEGSVTASWTFSNTPDEVSNWLVTANGVAAGPAVVDHFDVTEESGAALGDFTVGTAKNVRIRALDASDQVVTSFTGTVDITASESNLSAGGGPSPAFTAGVLVRSLTFNQLATGVEVDVEDSTDPLLTGVSAAFDVVLPPVGAGVSSLIGGSSPFIS